MENVYIVRNSWSIDEWYLIQRQNSEIYEKFRV